MGLYIMVDNVTSIASAVNERVIGSRHENLAIVLLLLALPSFYRKILIQPTGLESEFLEPTIKASTAK